MRLLGKALLTLWAVCLIGAGLWIGIVTGYANDGLAGAIALGIAGACIGAIIAAAGWAGVALLIP